MLFNSFHFLTFLFCVLVFSKVIPRRFVAPFLVLSSYYFYASWDLIYLPLLLGTTILDYFVCSSLLKPGDNPSRKYLLAVSIVGNLGVLAYFKYGTFIWDNLISIPYELLSNDLPTTVSIVLPVGISFYTFQSMGHSIDVYRRKFTEKVGFLNFALYVSFFPQLVAGPILRGGDFFPQISNFKKNKDIWLGLNLVLIGFIKKLVFADNLAGYIDPIFSDIQTRSVIEVLIATYAFAIQIYCDFSGYTDIARGVAKWVGFDIPINFNYPYFSTSVIDFWRRWHISLSNWLRDYLYISLGGNRYGVKQTYRNLMITMILGGFWHGAAWNFLLWGFYHGILLVLANYLGDKGPKKTGIVKFVHAFWTFNLVCFGWFIFRIESITDIGFWMGRDDLWHLNADGLVNIILLITLFFILHIYRYVTTIQLVDVHRPLPLQILILVLSLFTIVLFGASSNAFIYFQF